MPDLKMEMRLLNARHVASRGLGASDVIFSGLTFPVEHEWAFGVLQPCCPQLCSFDPWVGCYGVRCYPSVPVILWQYASAEAYLRARRHSLNRRHHLGDRVSLQSRSISQCSQVRSRSDLTNNRK